MVRKVQNLEIVIREFKEDLSIILSLEQGDVDRGAIVLCSGSREDVQEFANSVESSFSLLGFKIKRREEHE